MHQYWWLMFDRGPFFSFKYLHESWMNPGSFSQGLDIKLENQIRAQHKRENKVELE